jgi:hypothetical protein
MSAKQGSQKKTLMLLPDLHWWCHDLKTKTLRKQPETPFVDLGPAQLIQSNDNTQRFGCTDKRTSSFGHSLAALRQEQS